jgi:ribonucleases P/MRP protein subunit RPP40
VDRRPLEKQFPVKFTSSPLTARDISTANVSTAISPNILAKGDRPELELEATDIYEWLSLIRLGSSRVSPDDKIDPYLCRYEPPGDVNGEMSVFKVSWQGFISPDWVRKLLAAVVVAVPSQSWFAMSATELSKSFPVKSSELTLLRPPNTAGEYIMWDIGSSE